MTDAVEVDVEKWARDWMMSTTDRFVGVTVGDPRAWFAMTRAAMEHMREVAAKEADAVALERDDAAGSVASKNYHEYSDQARVAEVVASKIRRIKVK